MPPVMEERQEIDELLEENKDIAHFSESSYVFTDISNSVCNRVRLMITEVLFLGDSSFFVLCIKPIAILTFTLPFLLNVVTNPNCMSVLESPSYKSLGHTQGPRCSRGV